MSRYIKSMLTTDERMVYVANVHWCVYIRGAFFLLVGIALGGLLPWGYQHFIGGEVFYDKIVLVSRILALSVIAFATFFILSGYIEQISTEIAITNRRVIAKYGFFSRMTFELVLTRVEGANIDQTVMGRLLGYGTLFVKGTGGGISPIDLISEPNKFHTVLMKAIETANKREHQETTV